jgi:hypothetical protein
MINLRFDSRAFQKEMKNIIDYSTGFVDGIQLGKKEFLKNLGPAITEQASQFIDSNARVDYQSLHHIYEWGQVGSPQGRLFNISFTVSNAGLSFYGNFTQSQTIKDGSRVPFYNKAEVMEKGIPVTIEPVTAEALRFEVGGEVVYTKKPVVVDNPGGNTQGQFANVWDMFFGKYFTQAFLRSSGIAQYFENPTVYKQNLASGKRSGRSTGLSVGSRWVANAGKVA